MVSADPEFNNYIIQQEGKLVEIWYFDAISKLLVLDGESRINAAGLVHKYGKKIILSHIGVESIKERLLPQFEELIKKTLTEWSTQSHVEVKHAIGSVRSKTKIPIPFFPYIFNILNKALIWCTINNTCVLLCNIDKI